MGLQHVVCGPDFATLQWTALLSHSGGATFHLPSCRFREAANSRNGLHIWALGGIHGVLLTKLRRLLQVGTSVGSTQNSLKTHSLWGPGGDPAPAFSNSSEDSLDHKLQPKARVCSTSTNWQKQESAQGPTGM